MKVPRLGTLGRILGAVGSIWLALSVTACGPDSNIMGFLVFAADKTSHEYLLFEAETYLNQGDYSAAIAYGEQAYALDPGHEGTAAVLGFSYLGLAGADPFTLATTIASQASDGGDAAGGDTAASVTVAQLLTAAQDTAAEESGTSNPLGALAEVLGLSDAELEQITLPGNQLELEDGTVVEGAPSAGLFKDYPVLLPKAASEARAAAITLTRINRAIAVVCPFVNPAARLTGASGDSRHGEAACPTSAKTKTQASKIHFVWAFAHLTEAIAFNAVVMYDPTGAGPNLQRRTEALGDSESVGIAAYVSGVSELAAVIDVVFPTDPSQSADSMLTGMVNDLEATSRAFDLLPGMPAAMTSSIKSSLAQLAEQKAKIQQSGAVSDEEASSSALKDTLTEELGKNLEEQITTKVADGEVTDEQKAAVCAAYSQISTEAIAACEGL